MEQRGEVWNRRNGLWSREGSCRPHPPPAATAPQASRDDFILDLLLPTAAGAAAALDAGDVPLAASPSDEGAEAHVLPVRYSSVVGLSAARLWRPDPTHGPLPHRGTSHEVHC